MTIEDRVQRLPALAEGSRVETGAVQFGCDWPGLFIRGDDAFTLAATIRRLGERLVANPDAEVAELLRRLDRYVEIINRNVIVGMPIGNSEPLPPGYPPAWAVWRIDDNANVFLVRGGLDQAAAEQLAAEFTARGHKQMYWVEREDAEPVPVPDRFGGK